MEFKSLDKVLTNPDMVQVKGETILSMCPLIGYSKCFQFREINNEIYHLKQKEFKYLLNELIGEIISEFFALQTKKSIIVVDREHNFSLISKSFLDPSLDYCRFDDFIDVRFWDDVGLDNLDRMDIFYNARIEEEVTIKPEYLNILKNDLKKMLVRDFLVLQNDRSLGNFMFGYKNNYIKLMPLYDYEHSFGRYYGIYFNLLDFNLKLKKVRDYIKQDPYFQELLYGLLSFDFELVINSLENQYGIILNKKEIQAYTNVIHERQNLVRKKKIVV